MTDHNEVADVLDGAADVIERDGWHQGHYYIPGEGVCAIGAFAQATGLRHPDIEDRGFGPRRALAGHLGFDPDYAGPIIRWNDAPERTKQEVLDALRKAAKHERAAADGIDLGGAA